MPNDASNRFSNTSITKSSNTSPPILNSNNSNNKLKKEASSSNHYLISQNTKPLKANIDLNDVFKVNLLNLFSYSVFKTNIYLDYYE
jgi:hypothetical protein